MILEDLDCAACGELLLQSAIGNVTSVATTEPWWLGRREPFEMRWYATWARDLTGLWDIDY